MQHVGFPDGSDSKESACSAGDPGSIPGLGRSLEKETATHSSVLALRIPGMGKPGGLLSMGRTESDTTEATYSTVQLYVSERCSVSSLRVMLAVGRR